MARTIGSKLPRICSPADGYAVLAQTILTEPILVVRGQIEGNKEQALEFLSGDFANSLMCGLGFSQGWILENLGHESVVERQMTNWRVLMSHNVS